MRVLITGIFLCVSVYLPGCQSADKSGQSCMNIKKLIGRWSSTSITYPDDPVFRNKPPDTLPGRAMLHLQKDERFVFIWDDRNFSGSYRVDEKFLILANQQDGETVRCRFDFKDEYLLIEMDDGFKFKFKKIG